MRRWQALGAALAVLCAAAGVGVAAVSSLAPAAGDATVGPAAAVLLSEPQPADDSTPRPHRRKPSPSPTPSPTPELVAWSDPTTVPHLFYHSLIVDPGRAFRSAHAQLYRNYMVTVGEFRAQLAQLYANGYVLIHPERLAARGADGEMRATPVMLPKGKKPLVLSIDDVNYYDYMTGEGFASDLFFTDDGRLQNHYLDAARATQVGSYDVAPLVDDFVRDHPDFSYQGDKGTLAVTGFNGVLGYRSSVRTYGDTQATRDAAAKATEVATKLKQDGWNFASHSWGHLNFTTEALATLSRDAATWDAEVRPIVGPTKEFVFPFGADVSAAAPYTGANAKYAFLHDTEGFDYLFPIDATKPAGGQLSAGSWRQMRVNVDGISMTRAAANRRDPLWTFFDPTVARDPGRG